MKIWISGDYHLYHANIIKYCMRTQFMSSLQKHIMLYGTEKEKKELVICEESVRKMNETIIRHHNERVKPDDVFIHDGDMCFRNSSGGKQGEGENVKPIEVVKRLNGHKIFIQGNHDKRNSLKTPITKLILNFDNVEMLVVHNPEEAEERYKINLVAHVHNRWKIQRLGLNSIMYNVGVDVHDFMPINLHEIMRDIKRWKRGERK